MNSVTQPMQGSETDVCTRYLASVLQATSAVGVAAYTEVRVAPQARPLLVRAGSAEIPELSDAKTAATAIAARVKADGRRGESPIRFFTSASSTACLMRVAPYCAGRDPSEGNTLIERRARRSQPLRLMPSPAVWIGLSFPRAEDADLLRQVAAAELQEPREAAGWLAHTLLLVAGLLLDTHRVGRLLRDPTSQLPGRAEFQEALKVAFRHATETGQTLGLLLVNPDDFSAVNERLGREEGDRAVAEVAEQLRGSLRRDESIFRYGGAVFAVLVPAMEMDAVEAVARKIRESLSGAYLDGAVRLMFSVGAAVYHSDDRADESLSDLGLLRRADHALVRAKRAGGGRSVLWTAEDAALPAAGVDRLSGIFTANTEKDYRNMLLLWDTVALLSANAGKPEIMSEFAERIYISLKPSRVALLECLPDGKFHNVPEARRSRDAGDEPLRLGAEQRALLKQVRDSRKTGSGNVDGEQSDAGDEAAFVYHAVPITVDDKCLACLYVDGPAASFRLDYSDLIFLDALAGQLGLALDRVALAERVRREAEMESRRLREEVHDLRQVVQSARLIYSSQEMHDVLETLRAVASTDVTLLIDGESGTGKEMLARAVHEMSARSDKPLVVVDCGAIAHNLIDAELFGHTKGAYTGAHGSSTGRIAQAQGGTLFLDEIGELPLDVQAKLLRFVQEKEISPVGSTTTRQVDTRIVAATNRDLGREAAEGRFREDLYYRLSVVRVTAPPLRDRRDDILPLAKHFLDRFALQYHKAVRRLAPDAELYLRGYDWPGNVRELQNCMLRTVLLCPGESVPRSALQIRPEKGAAPSSSAERPDRAPRSDADTSDSPGDPWLDLRQELNTQVDHALADPSIAPVPLGRWLSEDLVREADRLSGGNARRAASELGIAETTFRRQLAKIQRANSQGLLLRSAEWARAARVIARLVEAVRREPEGNTIDRARSLLLAMVAEKVSGKDAVGAALMGVTLPTYRRWREMAPQQPAA